MGDHRDAEAFAAGLAIRHGEADAVDGHARLLADVAAVARLLPGDLQPPGRGAAAQIEDPPQAIHMAADQVAAETIHQPQRRFQIHLGPGSGPLAEAAAAQGLLAHVRLEIGRAHV